MKNIIAVISMAFAGMSLTVFGQTDLSVRNAIYFVGPKSSIDLKNDIYAANNTTLNVRRDLAGGCTSSVKTCKFSVGFIAHRSGGTSEQLSTVAIITVKGVGKFEKAFNFPAGRSSIQQVISIKLKYGSNQLSLAIDPNGSLAETNETNNAFTTSVFFIETLTDK